MLLCFNSSTAPTIGQVDNIQFADHLPADNSCNSQANHQIDYQFDSLGRPIGQTETIHNVSPILDGRYHQQQRYGQYGRLRYRQHAGTGTVIRHNYKSNGYLNSVTNNSQVPTR